MVRSLKTMKDLEAAISSLKGASPEQCARLAGEYAGEEYILIIDNVPEDPARQPLRVRARMRLERLKFPKDVFVPKSREIAARDFIARTFNTVTAKQARARGRNQGGRITIDLPTQECIETSAVAYGGGFLEVRFFVEPPLRNGKTVDDDSLWDMFFTRVPAALRESTVFREMDGEALAGWIETAEDADACREQLAERGLVAFIADGSVPAGRSSAAIQHLEQWDIITFKSPEDMAVMMDLPNRGEVRGMGIPRGITVVAGGAYQGKSTFLEALAMGVYNHIPGDGRELVVTLPDAVFAGVDAGRRIEGVDVSAFFSSALKGDDVTRYATESASAAASQAAAVMEAIEIGTSLLLIDEDASAPQLLGGDPRLLDLVPPRDNPVRRLAEIAPALRDTHDVSMIVGVSGTGGFLDVADTVLVMKKHLARNVTDEVRKAPAGRAPVAVEVAKPAVRCPISRGLEPAKDKRPDKYRPRGKGYVQYGEEFVEMASAVQLVSQSQARGIARAMALVHRLMDGCGSLAEVVDKVMRRMNDVGLDTLSNRCMGDLAAFRAQELAAAINRLKSLSVK